MDPSLLEKMLDPSFYPLYSTKVEHIQTHISHIFLTDNRAYKIKKSVDFGFLDYSSLEKRIAFSHKEVELNSRLSPEIYLDVKGLGRVEGTWSWLDPDDNRVEEVAVEMVRLPHDTMLKTLILEHRVPSKAMEKIANKIAHFHKGSPSNPSISYLGTPASFKENTDENFEQTEEFRCISISTQDWEYIKAKTEEFYQKKGKLMEERSQQGMVKDCHGDLHCEHICLWKDEVYIYDCIEFNQRFRCGDTASEVAFLTMDLEFLMRNDLAQYFLEHYLSETGDQTLKEVLPFYQCYRAFVRGKVESFRIKDSAIPMREKHQALLRAHRYFFLAIKYSREMV
jgi:aminoglycoside phosphotransferase family enzyme